MYNIYETSSSWLVKQAEDGLVIIPKAFCPTIESLRAYVRVHVTSSRV